MTATGVPGYVHVLRRWPAALALVAGGLTFLTATVDERFVHDLTEILVQLPVMYLLMSAIGRQRWSWPVFGAVFVLYGVLRVQSFVEPTVVFLAIGLGAVVWGAAHHGVDLWLQVVGMVVFGGLALMAFAVDPSLARYVVALGWLGHAAWDAVHLARDRVVARSYAEACGVLDLVVAGGLLLL